MSDDVQGLPPGGPIKSDPNGCGGKGDLIRPPQFRFNDSCNDHDEAYDFGGTEADRRIADHAFLGHMLEKASAAPKLYQPFYDIAAVVYFAAVRAFGWRHFNYYKKTP